MSTEAKPFFVKLPARGLIQVEGEERRKFLQGLVTNDIDKLSPDAPLYACLLTPQGKFLHDFFVIETDGVIFIDCEGGARAQDLYKRLNLYKLRSKVQISIEDENPVYAVFGDMPAPGYADPRHPEMNWRSFEKPDGMDEKEFAAWDERRIRLGVPDGSRDMEVERSTLLECRVDEFHGVSFEKGCFVGQELTARMHHRGLAKKHLYAVEGEHLPENGEDIEIEGKLAGTMRSSCGKIGLALVKDDMVPALPNAGIIVLN